MTNAPAALTTPFTAFYEADFPGTDQLTPHPRYTAS